ncbi:hypothetical protein KBD20_03590 [Candidatus Saccharibacteria bacterium]|nr:hypothetical protein [Candidatus Saccharibacteria bacterium]
MSDKKSKSKSNDEAQLVVSRIKHSVASMFVTLKRGLAWPVHFAQSLPERYKTWKQKDNKVTRYRSFKLQKRIKPELEYLPTSGTLIKESLSFVWKYKKIFLGIFFVHVLAYFVIIRAPIQPDVTSIQKAITTAVEGSDTKLTGVQGNLVTLSAVLGSTGATQQNGTAAVAVLFIVSLAYIWALRQLHNNNSIKIRDAFYQGMTAIVPVAFVIAVVLLELLPFAFASFIYTLARTSGIFVTGFEDLAFFAVTMFIGVLSFYWMTSGIIAMYMTTLPGIYPMYALHSARKLVQFQRLRVFRRMIALVLLFAAVYVLLLVLSIRLLPSKTFIIAEFVQLLFIPFIHTYLYKLYRSLL